MKRKVLHYYPDFGNFGGIERHIHSLTVQMAHASSFVPIVACSADTEFFAAMSSSCVKTYGIRTLHAFRRPYLRSLDLPSIAQLASVLEQERPSLVHVHIGDIENLWFTLAGCPVIYTFHGYGSLYRISPDSHSLWRFFKHIRRRMFRFAAAKLDRMLIVSHSEMQCLYDQRYLSQETKASVISPAVNLEAYSRELALAARLDFRQSLTIPSTSHCIGYIGRLDKNKGTLRFLEFASRLLDCRGFEHSHFVIIGDGPLRAEVARIIEANPRNSQFHYLGHRTDIANCLQGLDMTVFLPEAEGFGIGLLESMAAGTLAVAYKIGGLSELLAFPGGDQLLVEPTIDALLSRVMAILGSPRKEQIRAELRNRSKEFSISLCASSLDALYSDVLDHIE